MSVLIYDNQNKKDLSSIITMIHCLFNCDAWNEHFHNLSLNDFDIFKDIFQLYSKYISNKHQTILMSFPYILRRLSKNFVILFLNLLTSLRYISSF